MDYIVKNVKSYTGFTLRVQIKLFTVGGHGVGPCTSFLSGKRSTDELAAQVVKR